MLLLLTLKKLPLYERYHKNLFIMSKCIPLSIHSVLELPFAAYVKSNVTGITQSHQAQVTYIIKKKYILL